MPDQPDRTRRYDLESAILDGIHDMQLLHIVLDELQDALEANSLWGALTRAIALVERDLKAASAAFHGEDG